MEKDNRLKRRADMQLTPEAKAGYKEPQKVDATRIRLD
jgi:hypothetical protein